VIDPPGGTNPDALSPVEADGCVLKLAVPPPGVVTAEFVSVEPAEPGGVTTTMATDFELVPLIVPSKQVTGPVPVQPGDAETNVVPVGKVSTTCTPATDVAALFVTVIVYCTSEPAVNRFGHADDRGSKC